jgi:hypothetical protein
MQNQNKIFLDSFGEVFTKNRSRKTIAGEMKSKSAIKIHNDMLDYSDAQKYIYKSLSLIDDVLHNFLWMIEQYRKK